MVRAARLGHLWHRNAKLPRGTPGSLGREIEPACELLHEVGDHTLDRLATYVEPSTRAELLKFLIEEEDRLGTGPEQLSILLGALGKAGSASQGY